MIRDQIQLIWDQIISLFDPIDSPAGRLVPLARGFHLIRSKSVLIRGSIDSIGDRIDACIVEDDTYTDRVPSSREQADVI